MAFQWAVNILTIRPHWMTAENQQADLAPKEGPREELGWVLRRPFTFAQLETFKDHELVPLGLMEWLHSTAVVFRGNPHVDMACPCLGSPRSSSGTPEAA